MKAQKQHPPHRAKSNYLQARWQPAVEYRPGFIMRRTHETLICDPQIKTPKTTFGSYWDIEATNIGINAIPCIATIPCNIEIMGISAQ